MYADAETENWAPQHWSRQERLYMWTKGLDPRRIAKICRVPYRKVYDHIRTRVNHNPALFRQHIMLHDHPQLPSGALGNRRPTWEERAAALAEFQRTHGKFPCGYLEGESSLYSFLQHQRNQHRIGKLSTSRASYLNEHVPGWLTPRKQDREDSLRAQRAADLERFVGLTGRYPSYKKAKDPLEKVLATWMTRQRHCHRIGRLSTARIQRLETILPRWTVSSADPFDDNSGGPPPSNGDQASAPPSDAPEGAASRGSMSAITARTDE